MPELLATDLHKTHHDGRNALQILAGINIHLSSGDSLAIMGESGSGKSTLLHLLGALDEPDRGQIQLNGECLAPASEAVRDRMRRESLGFIFQDFNLLDSLTVADNLIFQVRLSQQKKDPDWVSHLQQVLGLESLLERYPETLSGGQKQRVAIARALAHRPALVLADEPTGNLDEENSDQVLGLLLQLQEEAGSILVLVTHSLQLAGQLKQNRKLRHGTLHRHLP